MKAKINKNVWLQGTLFCLEKTEEGWVLQQFQWLRQQTPREKNIQQWRLKRKYPKEPNLALIPCENMGMLLINLPLYMEKYTG